MIAPTTGFKTSSDCDRLQSSWICVLGEKRSRRAPARLRALSTSGLDHKLFARSRYKTGFETSCGDYARTKLNAAFKVKIAHNGQVINDNLENPCPITAETRFT